MPSRDNYLYSVRHFKFALWLLLVAALIASFFSFWKSIDSKVGDTSLVIAKRLMVDRANYHRQEWMIQGQPTSIDIGGTARYFSNSGWALPLVDRNTPNCEVWLQLLYPEGINKKQKLLAVSSSDFDQIYQCEYRWLQVEGRVIVQLVDEKFEVR